MTLELVTRLDKKNAEMSKYFSDDVISSSYHRHIIVIIYPPLENKALNSPPILELNTDAFKRDIDEIDWLNLPRL